MQEVPPCLKIDIERPEKTPEPLVFRLFFRPAGKRRRYFSETDCSDSQQSDNEADQKIYSGGVPA